MKKHHVLSGTSSGFLQSHRTKQAWVWFTIIDIQISCLTGLAYSRKKLDFTSHFTSILEPITSNCPAASIGLFQATILRRGKEDFQNSIAPQSLQNFPFGGYGSPWLLGQLSEVPGANVAWMQVSKSPRTRRTTISSHGWFMILFHPHRRHRSPLNHHSNTIQIH